MCASSGRACRTVRWNSTGAVHLDWKAQAKDARNSNLCFNGLDTFSQAAFEKGTLDLQVDTGGVDSSLFQRFAKGFPEVIKMSGVAGTKFLGGAGGTAEFAATILPEMDLGGVTGSMGRAQTKSYGFMTRA